MNRKIAFRAWNKKDKVMINAIFVGLGKVYGMTKTFKPSKELEDVILMQYTGLKDKNGKDIFEGDIARIKDYYENVRIGIIAFDSGTYKLQNTRQSFYYEFGSDGEYDWESIENVDEDNIEILGNIYENPELLNIK